MGLDGLLLLRFGECLRNLTGEAFAGLLAKDLGAGTVVVGHDFRFGARSPDQPGGGRIPGGSVVTVKLPRPCWLTWASDWVLRSMSCLP